MAITAVSLLGGKAKAAYVPNTAAQSTSAQSKTNTKDRGGLIGGVGYLGEKAVAGFVQSLEGIVDFGVGGIADLLGADAFAERQFKNDWFGDWYDTAGDWYNPSRGWKVAGDIAGGIGTSLPALAVSGIGIGIAAATGGAGTPLAVGLIAGSTAATAGLSAAGTATKEAYRKSGNLGLKEYGYGALVGVTEGAIEGVSNAIGVGTGAVVKSIAGGVGKGVAKGAAKGAGKAAFKSTIKSATASLGKHAILKTGVKAFAGEAFEEGVAELLSPIYARMTYDPEASLASPQEIAYAAFVGGMSGLVMGGATGTVNMARHNVSGNQIYSKGQAQSVVDGAKALLADAEKSGSMDTDAVKALKSVYDRFTASAGGTSAASLTGNQRRLLGEMNEASAAVVMNEAVISSAINIVQNADQITKTLEAYNYTDENGNKVTFTAEQLREGILGKDGKIKRDAIATALKNNTALRTLAAADAAGRLMMDTTTFADAMMQGTRVDEHSLNTFIENASEKKKAEVGNLLGVSDWNAVDAEEINARIGIYMMKGGAQVFEDRSLAVNAFEQHRGDKARAIPSSFKATKDGVYRYSSNGDNIAVSKYGDTYAIYDYDEKVVTRDLSRAELNRILAKHAREVQKSTESVAKPETVAEEGQTQEQPSASLDANETAAKEKTAPEKSVVARAREIAETKVKGYEKLSERNKSMVRKVIRQGIVKGIPEELLIDFANVSAHAKVDVVFDKDPLLQGRTKDGREVYANGAYDPHSDKIYINPDVQTSDGTLIHELDHAIRKTVKGGKVTTEIYAKALKAAGVDTYDKIADRYLGKAKNMTLEERVNKGKIKSLAEKLDVVEDEVEAFYAETVLGSRGIMKHLVSETPSLKQRILDFFKGAKADYRDIPNLDRQAAKYYRQYKKWFDEYAGNRRYKTMGDAAYANNTDTRYAIKYPSFSDADISRNMDAIADMEAVAIIDASRLEKTGKKPFDLFLEYFDVLGNNIASSTFGDIALNRASVKSEIRHGITAEKVASLEAIPAVIEQGKVIFSKKKPGTDVDRIVIAAPIKIADADYYMGVMLQRDTQNQRLYLHNVVAIKKEEATILSQDDSLTNWSDESDSRLFITSILQKALNVKAEKQKNAKKSSEPAKDSLGNTLTKEQADYFKDSKVRDKDGNLLAMYQGSAEEFYTFDRKKSKPSNLYGRGFYFTNSEDQARHYGKTRAFYLGVNNPVSTTERTITRSQMRKFLESVAENEDYSIENYGTYDVAKVLSSVYDGGRSDFAMLQDVNSTAIGDLVEAIELFNDINGTAYDGIILDTEVVTFRSNQAKLISNKNPTANPDMRLSLPESDAEYLSAVERGDMDTAQRMVDEAAKEAGYTIKAYHGTPIDGITVFDASKIGSNTDDGIFGKGFYFSTDSMTAGNYATKSGTVMPVFLAVKNPWWGNAYKEIGEVADLLDMSPSALTVRKSGISKVVAPVLSQSAQFSSHLSERGYDAVVVQHGKNNYEVSVFDNKQIKSADPVTYDDNGKIIPLSKRFDPANRDIRFSLPETEIDESATKSDGYRYTYDALTKKDDIRITKIPDEIPLSENGKINRAAVLQSARADVRAQKNENNNEKELFVYVPNIGLNVRVARDGIDHGLSRNDHDTALATMKIGSLLAHSIAVNELNGRETRKKKTEMSYVLFSAAQNKEGSYLVRIIVDKNTNAISEISAYGLSAVKAKKEGALFMPKGNVRVEDSSVSYLRSTISIADFFENVKSLPLANESFSADVLKKLGVSRSKGTISDSIRFSLPADADESAVELESVTAPSIPSIVGENLTVGQMRKRIANASHYKMYSKKNALIVVKQFDGADLLTQKTQDELATVLWKRLNEAKNRTEMKTYAHDVAEYILSRVMSEAKVEKTGAAMDTARARLSALRTYIGKVTFTESEIEEIRHVKDKKGLRQILGRWGYKSSRGAAKVPLDVFVTDIVGENADLAYLKELHPVDAFLELDSIYEDAKNTVNDKWESVYYDVNDEGLAQIVQDMENDILLAFEHLGEDTEYKERITSIVDRYKRRSDYWKAEHDKVNKVSRWHNIVADQAQKLKDIATHRFANATQIENDTLDQSIGDLAKVIRRGNISVTKVREVCDKLLMLYNSKPFRENVLEYFDENNAGYYNGLIETYLEVLSGAESIKPDGYEYTNSNGKSLSATELRMLSSVLSYFQNLYENYGKVWRRGQLVEALPLAQEFIGIAKSNGALPMGKIKSALARMTKSAPVQTFADPASVVRRIDLYQHGFYTEMFEQLREAAYNAEIAQMRVMKEYDEFLRENKGYMKKASRETVEFRGEKISKIKLISLYCTSKRKQAQAGLAINGYQYTGLSGDVIRVDGALDANAAYTEEEIGAEISKLQRELEKHLTEADKKYIALLENIYNNEARQLKVNRDLERNGFTNVEDGYYYPIRRANTATSVDKEMQGEIDRVSNASFNKDVVKGAKQEVLIESADDLIRRHVYAVCQYAHLSPVIDSYNRIYNLDTAGNRNRPVSVRTETRNVWAEGDAYMRKMFSDIQGITENGAGSKILSYIRGSYAISALAANPKVWATQLSSFAAASSLLDADLILKGAFASRQNLKDIFTYCPVAELRAYENTAAMAQAVVDNKGKARGTGSRALGATQKFGQLLMTPIGLVDKNVIKRLFGACQLQVERNSGGEIKVGTERNKIEAGKLLTRVIFETQQNTLSTEKSAAMRSGNEIYKALTMFSADAMKVVGRVFDSFGELFVLKERIKQATDPKVKSELQARLKVVKRSARKATVAIVATSVYMTALSLAFRRLYNKDEKETVPALIAETFGNMLGGLPVIRDVYSLILDGYDIDHYAYSAVNDMVKGMMSLGKAAAAFVSGDGSRQDLARSGKNVIFSVSQLTGIPTRNFYNVTYGLTKRFSPSTAYKIDSAFYEKNYANDLTKALEDGDTDMANMIYSILYNERVGVDISDEALSELHGLAARGYKVLPRKVASEITLDGVEYALSGEEQAAIQSEYARRLSSLDALVSSSRFQAMTDEEKEYAAQYLFDICYKSAEASVLGIDRGNAAILANVISAEKLTVLATKANAIKAEGDERRKKTVAMIKAMNATQAEKLIMICLRGYSVKDGDIPGVTVEKAKEIMLKYILSASVTKAQKEKLAKMCGFTVKDGKILQKSK